jgi:LuxR family transcriptional regulator, maltose regulon positive regulatory protein
MSAVLLKTKLYVPATRPELVPRPHLIERLNEGLSRKLILIAAPAGYGKTTLLSSWVQSCGQPVAWVSLDERDNEPTRFLSYLITAIQTIESQLGQDILSAMQSAQSSIMADWLPVLVNQLDSIATSFVLVLDDYHLITTPAIHQALAFLLEHQPAQLHLVIATRKDPPLPLPRLRARGQLIELRQADLRFTFEETSAFLRRVAGTELSTKDVSALVSRTEGWIAGLQMAALSLRNRADVSRLISTFGGSHEYIVDYFAAEVLDQQPESIKNFLLQTSILDRLYGSLCDAVTGQIDGQHTLEQLQQANLFVVSLSDDRCCYRYHHLLRDLLLKQLQQAQPERVPELQRRASHWCEEHDLIDDAIEHARAAHDEQRLGQLLDKYAEAFFSRGEYVTLLRWIAALPDDQRQARPALGIRQAVMLSAVGQQREAGRALQEVDQALANLDETISQNRELLGQAAAAHALVATFQDDPQSILFYARRALDFVPGETDWRSSVLLARSNAYFLIGEQAACIADLSAAIAIATAQNNHLLALFEMAKLAQSYWTQGQLTRAVQVCQTALQHIDQNALARSAMSTHVFITWGAILCERNDLDHAAEYVRRGLELSRSSQDVLDQLLAYRTMVRVYIAQRDLSAAGEFLQQAEAFTRGYHIPMQHLSALIGLKAQCLIRLGKLAEADDALRQLAAQANKAIPFAHHGRVYLSLAQLHMAQGNLPVAEQTLDRLFEFSQRSGQLRWVMPIQILRAVVYQTRRDLSQALSALEAAMDLSEPAGFIQEFLDEGEPMRQLLHEAIRHQVKPEFAQQLLNRFPSDRPAEKPIGLVEPLSDREIEVLKLVAEGLSNQEIAARLYLSLRTVKFHTSNIYGKLGVKSRTEAVAKARDLRLLSS